MNVKISCMTTLIEWYISINYWYFGENIKDMKHWDEIAPLGIFYHQSSTFATREHRDMKTISTLSVLCEASPIVTDGLPPPSHTKGQQCRFLAVSLLLAWTFSASSRVVGGGYVTDKMYVGIETPTTVTDQNVDKPKHRQPKHRQTETSTNRNVDKPKRRQTKTFTNQNVDRPERRQIKTSTAQNVDKPKHRQTVMSTFHISTF